MENNFLIRPKELCQQLGVTKQTIWRWQKEGIIPPSKRIGPNCVGWFRTDIESWLESRPTAKSDGGEL